VRYSCAALRVVLWSLALVIWAAAGCESTGLPGPEGPQGPPGADGSTRVYGDGSTGALTVAAGTTVELTEVPNFNLQFTDVTIENGGTLNTPNGAVIRCTGTFTNNGFLDVRERVFSGGEQLGHHGLAAVSISGDAAVGGEYGDESDDRLGGNGGSGLPLVEARSVLLPGVWGGGGGGSSASGTGGNGGGTIVILAQGGFINNATVQADGGEGTFGGFGGGGGGIIIIASPVSIMNNGTFFVDGGQGGGSTAFFDGPGGGGGGGIVHLLSPAITAGVINVNGGLAGAMDEVTGGFFFWAGGGGGGGCGGAGGNGGDLNIDTPHTSADDGAAGHVILSLFDPTSLF